MMGARRKGNGGGRGLTRTGENGNKVSSQGNLSTSSSNEVLPTLMAYPSYRFFSAGDIGFDESRGSSSNLQGPMTSNSSSSPRSKQAEGNEEDATSQDPSPKFFAELFDCLTEQPWHEVGQGPNPYGATNDHDIMVNQLTAILGTRLKELLVKGSKYSFPAHTQLDLLTPDATGDGKGYDLVPDLWKNLRSYVDLIAKSYRKVYYHSVEHCTHVTISTNKLLGMITRQEELRHPGAEETNGSDQGIESPSKTPHKFFRRRSTLHHIELKESQWTKPDNSQVTKTEDSVPTESDTTSGSQTQGDRRTARRMMKRRSTGDIGGDNEEKTENFDKTQGIKQEENKTRSVLDQITFGLATEPLLRFAILFSALIHDVDHQGVPNATLVGEEDELAILHNDISVAEQNSLQVAFSLLNEPSFSLLKSAIMPTKEVRKIFRKQVIDIVLATDISNPDRMQINQTKWKEAFAVESSEGNPDNDQGGATSTLDENKVANQDAIDNGEAVAAVSHKETKVALDRRRHSMYSGRVSRRQLQHARIGIRQSLQLDGKVFDAYACTNEGQHKLRQDVVTDLMMNIADVAHTMQRFSAFVKWNRRLYKELLYAFHHDRTTWDPTDGWFQNQINFFDFYIIPLAERMDACGVMGHKSSVFLYFAMENKRRWLDEGQQITDEMVLSVGRELLLLTTARYMEEHAEDGSEDDEDRSIDLNCVA